MAMNRRRCLQLGAWGGAGVWTCAASGGVAGAPRVPDVELLDHEGRTHALRRLCAVPVVLSFFYTGCTSVCPPQTAALRALQAQLVRPGAPGVPGMRGVPLLLSISVDPLGDSPAALAAHARRFGVTLGLDAGWVMLTGSAEALAPVWRAFDVSTRDPAEHPSLLWLGDARKQRWTRAYALAGTDELLQLIRREFSS